MPRWPVQGGIRGIGVDVERAHPLDPEVVKLIWSAQEREWIRVVAPPDHTNWPKRIPSAKEAAYKCLAPWYKRAFGFHDLEITLRPAEGRFAVRFPREASFPPANSMQLEGRFATSPRHVFTALLLTAPALAVREPIGTLSRETGPTGECLRSAFRAGSKRAQSW